MNAIVVYESMYGNTRDIANEIAAGLGGARVQSPRDAAANAAAPDLLVVGGPTQIHGLATQRSRAAAVNAAQAQFDKSATEEPGLRDWLESLEHSTGVLAAAFDTRLHGRRLLTGSAARGIARRLRRHGYEVIDVASFVVNGGEGPLAAGELERARAWGEKLAAQLPRAAASTAAEPTS
jgi:hypothetical protein